VGACIIVLGGIGLDLARRIGRKRLYGFKDTVTGWLTRPVGGNEE